jgi:hypothetical protein
MSLPDMSVKENDGRRIEDMMKNEIQVPELCSRFANRIITDI